MSDPKQLRGEESAIDVRPPDQLRSPVAFTQADLLALITKWGAQATALAGGGPVVALVGELVTSVIPGQRIARLHDFCDQLAERLGGVEESLRERVRRDPYASLFESALEAAVRTSSDERRAALASLLARGLNKKEADVADQAMLLRTLADLDDVDVVILGYHAILRRAAQGDTRLAAFRQTHASVLDVRPPDSGSAPDERNRWATFAFRRSRLAALGLLTGGQVGGKFEIAPVGRRLLEEIERHPQE